MRISLAFLILLACGCAPRVCIETLTPPPSGVDSAVGAEHEASEEETAAIWLQPKSHDFGTVKPGEELKLTLEVIRPEGTPLRLGRVMSSCTCVTVSAPKRMFGEGDKAEVYVSVKTETLDGKHEFSVTAEVLTPERIASQSTLTLTVVK